MGGLRGRVVAASEEAADVTLERRREGGSMRPRSARREARGAAIARVDATVDASIADIVDRRGLVGTRAASRRAAIE